MKLKKGVLIVLDGIDGTGKTTQAMRLLVALRNKGWDAALAAMEMASLFKTM